MEKNLRKIEKEKLRSEIRSLLSRGMDVSSSDSENEHSEDGKDESEKKTINDMKTTVLVGGVPVGTARGEIRRLFNSCGRVTDVRILHDSDNTKTTCVAFVDFNSSSSSQKACDMSGVPFKGKILDVKLAKATGDKGYCLFVKNLSFKTDEGKLRELFKDCGEINDIRIAVDRYSGKKAGFAWIDFKTEEGRQEAKKLNKTNIDGRQLLLSNAKKDIVKKK